MAKFDVKITVNFDEISSAFRQLARFDVTSGLKACRSLLDQDQKDHAVKEMGPDRRWAPLASTTRARYARDGKRRNKRILARLPYIRSIFIRRMTLSLESPVPWDAAHQDGPTRVGRGSRIPGRKHFWMSRRFLDQSTKVFERMLMLRARQLFGGSL